MLTAQGQHRGASHLQLQLGQVQRAPHCPRLQGLQLLGAAAAGVLGTRPRHGEARQGLQVSGLRLHVYGRACVEQVLRTRAMCMLCVRVCVCAFACVCAYACVHVHVHARARVRACVHACVHMCACMCVRVCTYMCVCVCPCVTACV